MWRDIWDGLVTCVSRFSQALVVSCEPVRVACWVDSESNRHHVSRRSGSGGLIAVNEGSNAGDPSVEFVRG